MPAQSHNSLAQAFGAPSGQQGLRWALRLWLEAAVYTSCALLVASGLGVPQSGFFAVFLGAAGLTDRYDQILDENRADIYVRKRGPWRANLATASSVLWLFLGAFSAFTACALWLGEAGLSGSFRFVLDAAALGQGSIFTRPFDSALALFAHNALVGTVFCALALVYRSYGALLAMMWNGCVWGLVLAFLVQRGVAGTALPPWLFVPAAFAAVLPHLILEAAGYVVGSLAAIFLAKALLKYPPPHPTFRPLMTTVATMLALALGCLLAGAAVEATLPRLVLSRLAR